MAKRQTPHLRFGVPAGTPNRSEYPKEGTQRKLQPQD